MDTNSSVSKEAVESIMSKLKDKVQDMAEHEALAESIDAELEARVINDELEAHKINETITQVAETFDALEAEGVDIPAMSEEDYQKEAQARQIQDMMNRYMKSRENHQPGKEHQSSDTAYVVSKSGAWVKKEKEIVSKPNMKNNSVRRKLAKNKNKYVVSAI